MEKTDFIDVSTPGWWLLELQLYNDKLEELRAELGEPTRWGWKGAKNPQWFTKPDNLSDIFVFLQGQSVLMTDLDALLDNEETGGPNATKRQKWLEDLLEAKPLPEVEPDVTPAESAQAKASAQTPPPPAAPAPPKVSAFGAKSEAAPEPKAAEPAPKSGLFDKAKASHSAEPAEAAGAAGAADAPPVPEAPPAAPPSASEIRALGDNPQAMISKTEVDELLKDPDFEAKLAAAMEKLDAELAAAESEE